MEYLQTIVLPMAGSFLLSALLLKLFIPVLRKVKLGQKILEIGPSWHRCKEGTPVLGGLFFLLSTLVAFGVWALLSGRAPDVRLLPVAALALLSGSSTTISNFSKSATRV